MTTIMPTWLTNLPIDPWTLVILAVIIIIVLMVVVVGLVARLRRRGSYNLEFPMDFHHESSADRDMDDRFMGRHYK